MTDTDNLMRYPEPVSISNLIAGEKELHVNNNLEEVLENLDIETEVFDECISHTDIKSNCIPRQIELSFEMQKKQMIQISEHIHKFIINAGSGKIIRSNSKVTVQYNAYWDGESQPFDSSYERGEKLIFVLGSAGYLQGFQQAIMSMKKFEESEFIISYELLFKEQGCPPRIKPKADALFCIKLLDYAAHVEDSEEEIAFNVLENKIKATIKKARNVFNLGQIDNAISLYQEAVLNLDNCNIADENDEISMRKLLYHIYRNLAVCYNRTSQPKKVCLMINEIRRLGDISLDSKCLYQEGRALNSLGEYDKARGLLQKALKINPDKMIMKELELLEKKEEAYTKEIENIWKNAFAFKEHIEIETKIQEEKKFNNDLKFMLHMTKVLNDFEKSDDKTLPMPSGLTLDEVKTIADLADKKDNIELDFSDDQKLTLKKLQ